MIQNLHIFENPEDLAIQFADQLMSWVENHYEDSFHLAISGGTTPNLLFSVLAEKYANSPIWQKIHFWWVDERMVPPNHPESNFGVANNLLFSKISIPKENIHRVEGESDPLKEALSYSNQIQKKLPQQNNWPVFNLILLGIGEDGHTASIFPNQLKLLSSKQICEVATHPSTGQKRITLTGKVINQAEKIVFLVTGSGKANPFSEISKSSEKSALLPAAHINPENGDLLWYADKTAAQYIQK